MSGILRSHTTRTFAVTRIFTLDWSAEKSTPTCHNPVHFQAPFDATRTLRTPSISMRAAFIMAVVGLTLATDVQVSKREQEWGHPGNERKKMFGLKITAA